MSNTGRHPAGCFFGGPRGETYWFAVYGCPLEHLGGDGETLWAMPENARDAWEHLRLAGLLRTSESG